jgi:hypothetical protein
MALMNFDPMGDRGSAPFEECDSTLKLAEDIGIGTRDLRRIEVVGAPIQTARLDFAKIRAARRASLWDRLFGKKGLSAAAQSWATIGDRERRLHDESPQSNCISAASRQHRGRHRQLEGV